MAHSILVIAYCLLSHGEQFRDKGSDYFDRINSEGLKRHLVKRLENLGLKVKLEPVSVQA